MRQVKNAVADRSVKDLWVALCGNGVECYLRSNRIEIPGHGMVGYRNQGTGNVGWWFSKEGDKKYDSDLLVRWLKDILTQYAVSVKDPWAQACIHGPCRILNRDQNPPNKIIGERVAIYCTKTIDDDALNGLTGKLTVPWAHWSEYADLPHHKRKPLIEERHHPGCIIGTVRVVGWCDKQKKGLHNSTGIVHREALKEEGWDMTRNFRGAISPTDDPWWLDATSHGWLLDDPQPLDEPIPVDGSDVLPGVWTLPDDLRRGKNEICVL